MNAPHYGIARLTERPDFRQLIGIVAEETRLLPAWVEKDYWVVRVLEAIAGAEALKGRVVFKGGTSLSKAWRIIDRFSEDIDLLLTGPDLGPMPERPADRAKLFKSVRSTIESGTPLRLPLDGLNEEEKLQYYLRSDSHGYMRFPLTDGPIAPGATSEDWLLVEAGFRGGSHPFTMAEFGSYVGEYIEGHPDLHELASVYRPDCTPVLIPVLGAERTFIEKLLAIHTAATGDLERLQPRHYYDVSRLATHPAVLQCLSDSNALHVLLSDAVAVSNVHWNAGLDLATLDLSSSPGLAPSDEVMTTLEARWRDEKDLYPLGQPSLASVLETIDEFRLKLKRAG